MNAAIVCLIGLAIFAIGYFFYSRFLAQSIFDLRADEPVPSRELEDGVDYVPTHRHVLFGHHYASIAGAAPIIGPPRRTFAASSVSPPHNSMSSPTEIPTGA